MLLAGATTGFKTSVGRTTGIILWLAFALGWLLVPATLNAQIIQINCGNVSGGQVPIVLCYHTSNSQEPNWPNNVFVNLYNPANLGGGEVPGYPQDDANDPYYVAKEALQIPCVLPTTVTPTGTIQITENVSACPHGGTIDIGVSGQNGGNSCSGQIMPQLVCCQYCRHGRRYCCCYWVTQPCCQSAPTAPPFNVNVGPKHPDPQAGYYDLPISVTNGGPKGNMNFVYGIFRIPANPTDPKHTVVPVKFAEPGELPKTFHAVWNSDAPSKTSSFPVNAGENGHQCNGFRVNLADPQILKTDQVYVDLFVTDTANNVHSWVGRTFIQ